jgi:hypothetical protein
MELVDQDRICLRLGCVSGLYVRAAHGRQAKPDWRTPRARQSQALTPGLLASAHSQSYARSSSVHWSVTAFLVRFLEADHVSRFWAHGPARE